MTHTLEVKPPTWRKYEGIGCYLNIVGKYFPLQVFALFCLAPLLAGLPTPEAESEGRGYPGLIQLDTNYVLPLLLAGAAFAKVALDYCRKSINR